MRKYLVALAVAALSLAPAHAQSGPKIGKDGGIGSSTSVYSGGEPTGGTYSINGTTGNATFNTTTLPPATAPASPTNGQCWTDATKGIQCRVAGATISAGATYTDAGTGGTTRAVTSKLADNVNVSDFAGCDLTGATDSATCVQNALNKFAAKKGGVVNFRGVLRLLSSITIPPGVTLKGQCGRPGSNGTSNLTADYAAATCGVIRLASTATISLGGASSAEDVLAYRDGMTLPAPDVSAFAGTAFAAAGEDVSLNRVMLLGFARGFYSSNYQRSRITDYWGDNLNEIEITQSADVPYMSRIHVWPFARIGACSVSCNLGGANIAIYLHDLVDWAKITDIFCYGRLRCIKLENVNSTTVTNGSADNTYSGGPTYTGSAGIEVTGTSADTRIMGFQSAAQQFAGVYVNTNAGLSTQVISPIVWGGTTDGVRVDGGNAQVIGGIMGGHVGITNGVTINNASSYVSISGTKFEGISNRPINPIVATQNVLIGKNDYGAASPVVAGSNLTTVSVASASAITLPASWDIINVSGTTNIGTVSGGYAGRQVTLVFQSGLIMLNSTGSYGGMRLAGAANFTVVAGSTLTLRHNGVQWYEVGRST